jgi:hypothetical protein
VKVLRVEANDCEGEDKLQKSKHEIDNICNGEARAAAISETHLAFCEVFRGDVIERGGSSRIWSGQRRVALRFSRSGNEFVVCCLRCYRANWLCGQYLDMGVDRESHRSHEQTLRTVEVGHSNKGEIGIQASILTRL